MDCEIGPDTTSLMTFHEHSYDHHGFLHAFTPSISSLSYPFFLRTFPIPSLLLSTSRCSVYL